MARDVTHGAGRIARHVAYGAGRMGRGIAHAFAYAGHEVRLIDSKPRDAEQYRRVCEDALNEIRGSLTSIAEIGGFEACAASL